MAIPDFCTDLDFLARIEVAVDTLRADFPERETSIGTGEIALANRIIIQRAPESCIYVHEWLRSDPDDLHDHPWDWVSIILAVGYWEISETGREWRAPGSVRFRRAEERHRVELDPSKPPRPMSLFITGPVKREWGFHTAEGFVVGREYRSIQAFRARRDAAGEAA